ncbi:MAG: phytoene desaturase [Polyangiaceae bacterium]|nr:phytoene desaturase [Polyangiaceae bacterium]
MSGNKKLLKTPHAIVIGSGFGGLAAAIRLGARGYRVTVLDKLDQPGGRAYVHRIDGHVFDAGPTVITAPFLFEELWTLCGKRLEDDIDLRPVSPFYRIRFDNGQSFDYTGDPEHMRSEVARFSPDDVAGYERFIAASEKIFKVGFEELAHVPFNSWTDMARILPSMVKLESYRTVYGLVSKYVKDERIRQVLSFHPLLVGGNPFSTTSIYTLIAFLERKWGVHFAMGGTGSLVKGLCNLIEGQGGTVKQNTEVRQIVVEGGRATGVLLANGERLNADVVVSNADSAWTYRYLVPPDARKRWTDRKIERADYSMSLFVWYFGTKKKYEDVAHHTILLGPRYKGLLDDIFVRHVLADDFSLYLHRPTATDPSLAPAGRDTFYVLSPVPNLKSGTDWSVESEKYRQMVEQYLDKTVLPGLKDNLTCSLTMNPQHFQDRLLSFRGAAFGIEPVLTQSAFFRPHNESEDIGHLYLVGAGTHPGAGLPGVLSSAKVLDRVVPHGSEIT